MADFNSILERIEACKEVDAADLIPYLCAETREERCKINVGLALAYSKIQGGGNLQKAKVFIQRAWILSHFSSELLPLMIKILSAAGDVLGIREAYKRLGISMARQGNIAEAIRYFNLWHYTYATFYKLDQYEYDFDILEYMNILAEPYRFCPTIDLTETQNNKIRIAFLVKGILEENSVLLKMNLTLAKYHDKSRFEIAFFTPDPKRSVLRSKVGRDNMRLFKQNGCEVVSVHGDLFRPERRLLALAEKINNFKPHVLMTSAALGDFDQYFMVALRPAPIMIGLLQGPPPQFTSPDFDWNISWAKHPLMDCPGNCSFVQLEYELPQKDSIKVFDRAKFNIPEDACLLMSAGRYPKFQNEQFLKAIVDVLIRHPDCYYVVVGPREDEIQVLKAILTPDVRSRVQILGWRDDYLNIIGMSDMVIDTFPSGGGLVILDAMALGIPVLSFANDYLKAYDQRDWSLADEYIPISDVIIPRGDFDRMKHTLSRLIEDDNYRNKIAEECRDYVQRTRGSPARMARQCEEIYINVINKAISEIANKEGDYIRDPKKKVNKFPSSRFEGLQQEHQALQHSRAVIIVQKLAEYPLLMRVLASVYDVLEKIYSCSNTIIRKKKRLTDL